MDKIQLRVSNLAASFDIQDLLGCLTTEERMKLASHLALERDILDEVVTMVITGKTSDGGDWWSTGTGPQPFEQWRVRLLEHLDAARFIAVREALEARQMANDERERVAGWAWNLWHSWPDGDFRRKPDNPPYMASSKPTDEEVREFIRKADERQGIGAKPCAGCASESRVAELHSCSDVSKWERVTA